MADNTDSHAAGSGGPSAPMPEPPAPSPSVDTIEVEQAREQRPDRSPPLPPRPESTVSSVSPSLQQAQPQIKQQGEQQQQPPQRQYYQAQPLPALLYQTHPQAQTYQHINNPLPFSAKWHRAKQILSAASMLCSTIVLIIAILLAAGPGAMPGYNYISDYTIVVFTPALLLGSFAILWQMSEAVTLCARKNKTGIHPGAHVGVQLIIWLIAAVGTGIMAAATAYTAYSQQELNSELADGSLSDSDLNSSHYGYQYGCYNVTVETCAAYLNGTVPLEIVLTLFAGLLFIIHFTLFVRACVETHQRNTSKRTVIIMPASTIPGTSGANGALGGPQMMQTSYYAPAAVNGASYRTNGYRDSASILSQQQQETLLPQQRAAGNVAASPVAQPMSQLYGFYAPDGDRRVNTAFQQPQQRQAVMQTRAGPSVVQSSARRSKGKGKEVAPPSRLNTVDESASRDDLPHDSHKPAFAGSSNGGQSSSGDGGAGTEG